jgi:hypothetical protein
LVDFNTMRAQAVRISETMTENYPTDRKPAIAAEFARLADNDRHRQNVRLLEEVFAPLTESITPAQSKANNGPSKAGHTGKSAGAKGH